ncbi:MAG: SMC-Scp complex subunit ScpB [Clostridia bacterium]|nr:SMC-Scp complex subunit ScpB [Clostridia bacterium]
MLAIAEAVLFAAAEPIEHTRLSIVLGTDSETTLEILDILKERYEKEESGLCLLKLGSKYQLCSKKEYINEVRAVLDLKRNTPLSQAAFEVLAIIAYNQPITKPYIEQIRGVDCSGVVSTLCQRGLIEEKGRLEVPGRPVLYGTTDDFLRCFSLSALSELEELPNVDKQLLMSDIDSGQLSLFDDGESNDEAKTDEKEPIKVAE